MEREHQAETVVDRPIERLVIALTGFQKLVAVAELTLALGDHAQLSREEIEDQIDKDMNHIELIESQLRSLGVDV